MPLFGGRRLYNPPPPAPAGYNAAAPSVSGIGAQPGASVSVYNGAALLGSTTAAADGSYTLLLGAPLTPGSALSLTATQMAAGVVSLASPALTGTAPTPTPSASAVITKGDMSTVMAALAIPAFAANASPSGQLISVDRRRKLQPFYGVGAAITDSVAYVLMTDFSAAQRAAFLQEVFGTNGFQTLRICIGTSDFSFQAPYTYADGATIDTTLANFSISKDLTYVIPVLKQILAINPNIRILASPWSPPTQFKLNASLNGPGTSLNGQYFFLNKKYRQVYAQYLVKFLQAYAAQGVPVAYISCQNEGTFAPTYPGCIWAVSDETTFNELDLGPAIAAAGLPTKILAGDDNWGTGYAAGAVTGQDSSQVVGAAYHCYAGKVYAQVSDLKNAPTKEAHVSEYCIQAATFNTADKAFNKWVSDLMIGACRYRASSVTAWNLVLETNNLPANQATSANAYRPLVNVTTDGNATLTRNPEYYAMAHRGKYVKTGAYRIASTSFDVGVVSAGVETVAFLNPDGSVVVDLYNATSTDAAIALRDVQADQVTTLTVPARALVTVTYSGLATRAAPATTSTPWTPAVLATKYGAANVFWIDPTDSSSVTLSGSSVTAVANKGGYGGSFTQGTAANQPAVAAVDGVNFLQFSGKQSLAQASMAQAAAPLTFVSLARYAPFRLNSAAYPTLLVSGGNAGTVGVQMGQIVVSSGLNLSQGAGYNTDANGYSPAPSGDLVDLSPMMDQDFHIQSIVLGPNAPQWKIDGVLAETQFMLPGTPVAVTGALQLSSGWAGEIGPTVGVRAELTSYEIEQLEGWAAWTGGKQNRLDPSHAFYAAPPFQ